MQIVHQLGESKPSEQESSNAADHTWKGCAGLTEGVDGPCHYCGVKLAELRGAHWGRNVMHMYLE